MFRKCILSVIFLLRIKWNSDRKWEEWIMYVKLDAKQITFWTPQNENVYELYVWVQHSKYFFSLVLFLSHFVNKIQIFAKKEKSEWMNTTSVYITIHYSGHCVKALTDEETNIITLSFTFLGQLTAGIFIGLEKILWQMVDDPGQMLISF